MSYPRTVTALFAGSLLAAATAYWQTPQYRGYLLQEDSLIENLSAAFYLSSFLVCAIFFCHQRAFRKTLLLVAGISIVGFLDELSFGERLFTLTMPTLDGVKIDAVHDLALWAYIEFFKAAAKRPLNVYGTLTAVLLLVGFFVVRHRAALYRPLSAYQRPQALHLLAIFAALITLAIIIDLDIVDYEPLFVVEELAEMTAALALFFCGLSLRDAAIGPGSTGVPD